MESVNYLTHWVAPTSFWVQTCLPGGDLAYTFVAFSSLYEKIVSHWAMTAVYASLCPWAYLQLHKIAWLATSVSLYHFADVGDCRGSQRVALEKQMVYFCRCYNHGCRWRGCHGIWWHNCGVYWSVLDCSGDCFGKNTHRHYYRN